MFVLRYFWRIVSQRYQARSHYRQEDLKALYQMIAAQHNVGYTLFEFERSYHRKRRADGVLSNDIPLPTLKQMRRSGIKCFYQAHLPKDGDGLISDTLPFVFFFWFFLNGLFGF